MKHFPIFILAFCFAIVAVSFTGCYPEGGARGGNINAPDYRIIGTWQITHTTLNGTEIDSTDYLCNQPATFYYFYADHVLNVMTYYNGQIRESTAGFWYFKDKNKILNLDFSLVGQRTLFDANIIKLTRRELIYEYDDEEGNHWKIQLNNRSII